MVLGRKGHSLLGGYTWEGVYLRGSHETVYL